MIATYDELAKENAAMLNTSAELRTELARLAAWHEQIVADMQEQVNEWREYAKTLEQRVEELERKS